MIVDVSPLASLINLHAIDVEDNEITDFTVLCSLQSLRQAQVEDDWGCDEDQSEEEGPEDASSFNSS